MIKWLLRLSVFFWVGCATVEPYDKGFLASPLMTDSQGAKISLEEKFFSTQEGSAGGTEGMAGGCGCAK